MREKEAEVVLKLTFPTAASRKKTMKTVLLLKHWSIKSLLHVLSCTERHVFHDAFVNTMEDMHMVHYNKLGKKL